MDLTRILQNIGLSSKEAKIYLALLDLGEALPSTIAKKAAIKRPTTYLILDQLLDKGLVTKIKKKGYSHFQPINPHSLLEDQYQRFHDLETILPELLEKRDRYAVQPDVAFYEGRKGLIRIMEDTLTSSGDILTWMDASLAAGTVLKDYYPTYIKKKKQKNIWVRGIFTYDQEALKFKKSGPEELREVYLIPKKEFPFKNEINIYNDKVAIISHEDQMGVIIRNQNIADTQRSIFKLGLRSAKILEQETLTKKDRDYLGLT